MVSRIKTGSGDLACDEAAGRVVWRIGHITEPWAWAAWQWVTDDRFTGRWDAPTGYGAPCTSATPAGHRLKRKEANYWTINGSDTVNGSETAGVSNGASTGYCQSTASLTASFAFSPACLTFAET